MYRRYLHRNRKERLALNTNKRRIGSCYEEKAAAFLEQKGLVICVRNFRCRCGEIDLIAQDGEYLVFVEVKYRGSGHTGSSLAAVDKRKQYVITQVAQYYMTTRLKSVDRPCRFDVIGFDGEKICWIPNAFDACGRF